MSVSFTASVVFFLLMFLRVHSTSAQFLPDYEFPEIDGSAVDETCRIFVVDPTEDTPVPSTTRPETTTSTRTTKKLVVTTTKKPTIRPSPQKPVTKAPIRAQPATNRHNNVDLSFLHFLLANNRRHSGGSQSIGGLDATSSSDESAGFLKISTFSSEDSSDES